MMKKNPAKKWLCIHPEAQTSLKWLNVIIVLLFTNHENQPFNNDTLLGFSQNLKYSNNGLTMKESSWISQNSTGRCSSGIIFHVDANGCIIVDKAKGWNGAPPYE